MCDRNVQLRRRQCTGQRGIGVAINKDAVRPQFLQQRLQPLQHCPCHGTMAAAVNVEVMVGGANTQLLEKDIRHPRIMVLAGVDEYLANPTGFRQRLADWGNLDELRAGANDGRDFLHGFGFSSSMGHWAGRQMDDSLS